MMHRALISLATFALPLCSAVAGVTVTSKRGDEQNDSVMSVEGNRLRMDSGHDTSVIFDGESRKMIHLDHDKKTYSEMTFDELKQRSQQAQQYMRQSMAQMSPEKREQMKQAMSKMNPQMRQRMEAMMSPGGAPTESAANGASPELDIQWKDTGSVQRVAGFPCRGMKELREGKVDGEGCYIPWSAGALKKSDFTAMTKVMSDFASASPLGDQLTKNTFARMSALPGFPGVWTHLSEDGKPEGGTRTVTSVRRGSVPAERFQPPAGYARQAK